MKRNEVWYMLQDGQTLKMYKVEKSQKTTYMLSLI
jgi:hypothetical protein